MFGGLTARFSAKEACAADIRMSGGTEFTQHIRARLQKICDKEKI